MASCITTQWAGYAPQVRLTVTQSGEDATTATLAWKLEYVAHGYAANVSSSRTYTVTINGSVPSGGSGSFNINGVTSTKTMASGSVTVSKTTSATSVPFNVSFPFNLTWSGVYKGTLSASSSISIKAKTSYTVSYNANGGSGAPSSQTKWHGTNLTLSSTKPSRTGYSFQGWALTKADADAGSWYYSAGGTCGKNENLTLYATWKANTYTVKFNANGGSGAPGNQTKTYGKTLTLSSTKPTRTNYNFLRWNTNANGTGTSYNPGGSYTANAATTLYAIWELAYVKPRVSKLTVTRCRTELVFDGGENGEPVGGEDGNIDMSGATEQIIDDETGTKAYITLSCVCDRSPITVTIAWSSSTASSGSHSVQINASSISAEKIVFGNNSLDPESVYSINVTVSDSGGSVTLPRTLNSAMFPIDVLDDDKGGIAFGKAAKTPGLMDVGFKSKFNKSVQGMVYGLEELERIPDGTDLNSMLTPGVYAVDNHDGFDTLLHAPTIYSKGSGAGRLIVSTAVGTASDRATWLYIHQEYIPLLTGYPVCKRLIYTDGEGNVITKPWVSQSVETVLYENDSGSSDTITLLDYLSSYRYIEIYFTDNNGVAGGYTKVYRPAGKAISLGISEGSSTIYHRQTVYTASGITLTPNITNASYFRINTADGAVTVSQGTNYIKIVRVVGRA